MVTTPVSAAFNYCIEADLNLDIITMLDSSESIPEIEKNTSNKPQFCHASGHCNAQICNVHPFLSSQLFYEFSAISPYFYSKNTAISLLAYAPELRPPIN